MSADVNRDAIPVEVLLVEDNPEDALLMREALQGSKLTCNLHVVRDGEAALDFLRREGQYVEAPLIELILLDLNLPRMDGFEVLTLIKSDESLKQIPVVVLTTSEADEDALKAYNLNASCFIIKPMNMEQFFRVVRVIETIWSTALKLPIR